MTEFVIGQIIKAIIFPPGIFVVLMLVTLWLLKDHMLVAKRLLIATALSLYLLSLPVISALLMIPLEPYPALSSQFIQNSPAQAIVILSAGRMTSAAEYDNQDVSGDNTTGRLKYGARLQRITQLPILVTGGLADEDSPPLSRIMAADLKTNFDIETKWLEEKSKNTAENAIFSRELLQKEGINHIFLVTSAWHMRRAVAIFEKQGFIVTPAPTRFEGFNSNRFGFELSDFLPGTNALRYSYFALHELLGTLWYNLRY